MTLLIDLSDGKLGGLPRASSSKRRDEEREASDIPQASFPQSYQREQSSSLMPTVRPAVPDLLFYLNNEDEPHNRKVRSL